MYRHGLGTRTERLSMSHIVDMMLIEMLAFEATSTHVMIGLGVVDLVHVITKNTRGMLFFSGSLSTPGFLILDAYYAIHHNPRITIFTRYNRLDIIVHHPLQTIHKVLHK